MTKVFDKQRPFRDQVSLEDRIKDYQANGGTITKLPAGKSVEGHQLKKRVAEGKVALKPGASL